MGVLGLGPSSLSSFDYRRCSWQGSSLTSQRAASRASAGTRRQQVCNSALSRCGCKHVAASRWQHVPGSRCVSTRRHAKAEMSVSNSNEEDKSASEQAAEPKALSQELGNVQSPASVWLPQPDASDKVSLKSLEGSTPLLHVYTLAMIYLTQSWPPIGMESCSIHWLLHEN